MRPSAFTSTRRKGHRAQIFQVKYAPLVVKYAPLVVKYAPDSAQSDTYGAREANRPTSAAPVIYRSSDLITPLACQNYRRSVRDADRRILSSHLPRMRIDVQIQLVLLPMPS